MKLFLFLVAVTLVSGSPVRLVGRNHHEVSCSICQHLTQDLHNVLSGEDTKNKVVSGLLSRCDQLVSDQNEVCTDIVHSMAPNMVHFLTNKIHPYVMCSSLEMCPEEPNPGKHVAVEHVPEEHTEAIDKCEFCQFAINIVERYAHANGSIPKLNETMYHFCNSLPDPFKTDCLNFAPKVIQALAEGVPPHEACVKAHVCPNITMEYPHWKQVTCDICNGVSENMFGANAGEVCTDLKICLRPTLPSVPQPRDLPVVHEPEAVDKCAFCQFVINIVERYAHANGSIPKLNETMYHFCNSLPDPFKTDCLNFAPKVMKALAEGVPPHEACVKAHVCPNNTLEFPLPDREIDPERDQGHVEEMKAGPGCELCQFVVNVIDQYLKNNHTEAAINATVYKICNDLPEPLKDTCLGFAPKLVKILAQGFDPKQACTKIGLCETEEELVPQVAPLAQKTPAAGPACELCQFVVNVIDQYLKNNHTEAAINATVYKICNELPEPLKDTCLGFAPKLVSILAQGFDPKQACTKIGLCATKPEVESQVTPLIEEKPEAGPACELCQFVVNVIDQYLKNNHTEAAINATVYKICNELPEPLKDTCLGFAPQLVKILAQGFDPKQACTKIGLCATSTVDEEHRTFTEEEWERLQAGPGCELCQFVVNVIDQYLKNNHSEAAINATITKICNDLPEPLKDTCLSFAPKLVKFLAQGFDPKQACTKIGLCSSVPVEPEEDEEVEENPEEVTVSGPACELCQFVVNVIDQYLKNNHTEAAINATVYKICNELPEPLKDTCLGFAPQLVKILAQGFDPKQACTKIGLCATSEYDQPAMEKFEEHPVPKHEEHPVPEHEEQEITAGPACELCQFVVNVIDQYLKNNHTEAAINATVYRVCNELPEPLKDTCLGFAPKLVTILAKGFDPKQACTKIGLCSSTEHEEYRMEVHEEVSNKEPKEHEVIAGPACELCQFVVNVIDQYLKNNHTEAAINSTVYRICNKLPEPLKDTCLGFAPELVKILAEGFDPKQACTKIGLCSANDVPIFQFMTCDVCHSTMEKVFPEEFKKVCAVPCTWKEEEEPVLEGFAHEAAVALKKPESTLVCELCILLVKTVDAYLKNNHSEAAINSTIYKICATLPAALKLECHVLAPLLVKELAHGLNSTKACTDIHACPGDKKELLTRVIRGFQEQPAVSGKVECDLCKDLIGIIDMGLDGDENKTKQMFDDVCHRLPPPTDQKCLDFVDPNFPKIWNEIVHGKLAPGKVCHTLKLCKEENSTAA